MNPNLTAATSTNTGTAQYSGDSMQYSGDSMQYSGDSREVNPTIENHLECKSKPIENITPGRVEPFPPSQLNS